ncbi:MFS-type transporter SLC18B1-like [Stylophora pistillata]|uniref:MFS-type transporter SLC18B1-like n=1 Tax=Stylophora pistillata TaxID=50429 RepID=UPI000C053992|nr:MFS-type transporter SLC18B1-like [Stylophora pistillata]
MTITGGSEIKSEDVKKSLIVNSLQLSEKEEKCSSEGNSPGILHMIAVCVSNGLCGFMVFVTYSLFSPFFPQEARDKGVSGTIVGLLFGSYSFVIFIFSPFCGVLIPKYGPSFVLYSGIVLCGGSTFFFGFCDMIADRDAFIVVCFVLRVTSAIGGAAVETSGLSILLDTFPDNVGMVSGMIETCAGAGFSFGPVVGGLLYTVGGFKLPFFVTGGTMIAVIPILALALGKGHEMKTGDKEPISMLEVLKIPAVLMLSSCFVVCGVAFSCLEPILGPHLKQMGQNPSQIGLAFLWWAGTYTLLAPIVGFIGDKTKCYRSLMIMGFIGFFIGSLLVGPAPFLSFLPAKTIWLVTVAMFTNGILGGFAFVPIISDLIRTLR